MTLKEYLEETKIGNNTFARTSGVDPAVISRLARGLQTGLRLETAEAIVRASGGLISFEDLCSKQDTISFIEETTPPSEAADG